MPQRLIYPSLHEYVRIITSLRLAVFVYLKKREQEGLGEIWVVFFFFFDCFNFYLYSLRHFQSVLEGFDGFNFIILIYSYVKCCRAFTARVVYASRAVYSSVTSAVYMGVKAVCLTATQGRHWRLLPQMLNRWFTRGRNVVGFVQRADFFSTWWSFDLWCFLVTKLRWLVRR